MKNKYLIGALVIAAVLAVSGCGKSSTDEQYNTAVASLETGDFSAAQTQFEDVIQTGEKLAESYRGLAISLMYQQNFPEASIAFEKALLNQDVNDVDFTRDVYSYLAYCRNKQGKIDEALKIYNELIAQEESPELLFLRGKIYMSQDKVTEAEADFNHIMDMSDDYEMFIAIYEVYDNYRMNANGASFLEKALDIAENNNDDHYGRGIINYYLEDYEEAKNELVEALRSDNENKDAILLLGKTYLAMDDIADARAMYKEYYANVDTAACAYNGIALCDMSEGLYENALSNIEKGLETADSEDKKSLLYNEIIVYEKMRDWEKAKTKSKYYVALYPMEEAGQREYEFLQTR